MKIAAATLFLFACSEVDAPIDPGPTDPPTQAPWIIAGTYSVSSLFDVREALSSELSTLIHLTDDPNDPGEYIVDMIIAESDGLVRDLLEATRNSTISYVNDRLNSAAPNFVERLINFGQDLGELARYFGVTSTLTIAKGFEGYDTNHTITGAVFRVDGETYDISFASEGLPNVVVRNLGLSFDSSQRVEISPHTMDIPMGHLVHLMVDNVLIPRTMPGATNLNQVLNGLVDCAAVGESLADQPGIFDAEVYQAVCVAGLANLAESLYNDMVSSDTQARFIMRGSAQGRDNNGDRVIDAMLNGRWNGTVDMGEPAELRNATFTATRPLE